MKEKKISNVLKKYLNASKDKKGKNAKSKSKPKALRKSTLSSKTKIKDAQSNQENEDRIYSKKYYQLCDYVEKRDKKNFSQKYKLSTRVIIALVLSICLAFMYFVKNPFEKIFNFQWQNVVYEDGFHVHFIDVGQGKSIVIKTDDGKNILIDSGKQSESLKFFGYLEQYFFTDNNEKIFDYFIITHLDNDHLGNSVKVFEDYEVKNCYRPKIYTPEEAGNLNITNPEQIEDSILFTNYVNAISNENCNVHYNFAGETIQGLNYDFNFITPNQDAYNASNDYSPIIMLTCNLENEVKFLFTGDATKKIEKEAINAYGGELKADVLDIAHHGSRYSSTQEFLNLVMPEYAVFSVGVNSYGMPSEDVIYRLTLTDVNMSNDNIYRTDNQGTIVFSTSETGELSVSNQDGINLNASNYTFLEIYAGLEAVIVILCFSLFLPANKKDT